LDLPAVELAGLDPEIVEAVEDACKAVRQSPRSAEAWGKLGAVLRAHEFFPQSNTCFARAEKLDPEDPRWPYLIALDLLRTDSDAARGPLQRAAGRSGERSTPRLRLGEYLVERGEPDEAEPLFRVVLERGPRPYEEMPGDNALEVARAHLGLGRIALGRGDVRGALEHLRRAAAGAPQARFVREALAQAYRRSGDDKAAEEALHIASGLPLESPWPDPAVRFVNQFWVGLRARLARIDVLERTQRHEEALLQAQAAVHHYPESALARLTLGKLLNRAQDVAAAEPLLHEVVRREPGWSDAHFELGLALQGQQKLLQAMASYREAVRLQPDFAGARYNLALCLLARKDEAGAVEEFRAAIRYRPEFVEALLGLALVLDGQGRHEEARGYVEEAARVAPLDRRPAELLEKMRKGPSRAGKP
jgi:tetratricopeptide (TPR) repeat protein